MRTSLGARVIVAALGLAALAHCTEARAGYFIACGPHDGQCVSFSTPAPARPIVQHVNPVIETDVEIAAREVRVKKWEEFCKPRAVADANGVLRNVYAMPGCEFGRAE